MTLFLAAICIVLFGFLSSSVGAYVERRQINKDFGYDFKPEDK
jgi:uncharacterized protein YneF (UPF0154 family)